MKSTATLMLLVAMVAQHGSRYLIMLNFEMNKSTITKTLCINRDKPMNGCHGKCYLKKQLAKSAKENAPNSNVRVEKDDILFYSLQKNLTTHCLIGEGCKQYAIRKKSFLFQPLYSAVFHPPQAA